MSIHFSPRKNFKDEDVIFFPFEDYPVISNSESKKVGVFSMQRLNVSMGKFFQYSLDFYLVLTGNFFKMFSGFFVPIDHKLSSLFNSSFEITFTPFAASLASLKKFGSLSSSRSIMRSSYSSHSLLISSSESVSINSLSFLLKFFVPCTVITSFVPVYILPSLKKL